MVHMLCIIPLYHSQPIFFLKNYTAVGPKIQTFSAKRNVCYSSNLQKLKLVPFPIFGKFNSCENMSLQAKQKNAVNAKPIILKHQKKGGN